MRAVSQDSYGPPDRLKLKDVGSPEIGDDEVLVRIRAAGVNPGDWHIMRGEPYLVRLFFGLTKPKVPVRGLDAAGRVEAVGGNVTRFEAGDEVFGEGRGTFAEYAVCKENKLALKPEAATFEESASVPVAGVTALQGLRDHAELGPGQSVLINGASGGVGTFAVQIAKAYGAEVTGVCSTRNLDMVRGIGADHAIDYTRDDFTGMHQRYDVIFDLVGNHSLAELRGVLSPDGALVLCSGSGGRWIGPMATAAKAAVTSPFRRQRIKTFISSVNTSDLEELREQIESGAVTPVIDRTYPLHETQEAIRYLEEGHARGKVVITQ